MARRRRGSKDTSDFLSDILDDIKDFVDDEIIDRGRETERALRRAGRNWTDSDDAADSESRHTRRSSGNRDEDLDELRQAVLALSRKVDQLNSVVGVTKPSVSNPSHSGTRSSTVALDVEVDDVPNTPRNIYYDDVEPALDLLPDSYIAKRVRFIDGTLCLSIASQDESADAPRRTSTGTSQSTAFYIDTDDDESIRLVTQAVDGLNEALGYGEPQDIGVYRGSFFRRSWAAVKRGLTSKELRERAIKAERALELKWIETLQAEVDNKQADAIHKLVTSLDNVPEACIRCGSILLIKCIGGNNAPVILTRTLSQLEIRTLEQYPEIQKDPRNVLSALAVAVAENDAVYQIPQIESGQ